MCGLSYSKSAILATPFIPDRQGRNPSPNSTHEAPEDAERVADAGCAGVLVPPAAAR